MKIVLSGQNVSRLTRAANITLHGKRPILRKSNNGMSYLSQISCVSRTFTANSTNPRNLGISSGKGKSVEK